MFKEKKFHYKFDGYPLEIPEKVDLEKELYNLNSDILEKYNNIFEILNNLRIQKGIDKGLIERVENEINVVKCKRCGTIEKNMSVFCKQCCHHRCAGHDHYDYDCALIPFSILELIEVDNTRIYINYDDREEKELIGFLDHDLKFDGDYEDEKRVKNKKRKQTHSYLKRLS